ncbi:MULTISPECIES: MarR family winged helix-turn-helix transcriptional regulator [Arthrobacter]|uniref:MarR family winged helix-turn-helix transcriptional regulator n=2 Tax=Arthrobacter TaxID=1663 RepID=A0ABU9KS27_9MICC|nr:MarR family winged helix-turn-helix transcriptional regulator [Arthrobacter sp. YJM1]MDP5228688.1 MarR family winged helix-turn-helix transcriptional regulator [Arthrobacter sp. YJM1]
MASKETPGRSGSVRLAAESWEALFRAQVAVMSRLHEGPAFRTGGERLSDKEYDVLFTLSRCPSGWLRLHEINEGVLLNQSSLSRMVERLEKRGLLERMTAPEDGRGVLIRLTEEGIAAQKEVGRAHVRDIAGLLLPALDAEELEQLRRLTTKLRANLPERGQRSR